MWKMNLLLLAAAVVAGGTSAGAEPASTQTTGFATGYRIGPNDLLEVRVFEVPELNVERRVSEEGTIALPLIGDFPVHGMTQSEASFRLRQLLEERYVHRASVTVQVREFRSKPISVLGAIKNPGNLPFSGNLTLLEVLAAAGGLTPNHGDVIYVLRRADNGLTDQLEIRIDELMVRADPKVNIPIVSNDLINVPVAVEITVFATGEVGRPGAVSFKSTERMTLLAAIARAGGLTGRASNRIIIRRHTADGGAREITANYRRIVAGREPDPELEPGDILVVRESFF